MGKIFLWCLTNIKTTLAILGFCITIVFIPTIKEGVAFINAGYQSTKDNARQDQQISKLTENQFETKASLKNIENLLTKEFEYRRRKR